MGVVNVRRPLTPSQTLVYTKELIRGETIWLHSVWKCLYIQVAAHRASGSSHWSKALWMQSVWKAFS